MIYETNPFSRAVEARETLKELAASRLTSPLPELSSEDMTHGRLIRGRLVRRSVTEFAFGE